MRIVPSPVEYILIVVFVLCDNPTISLLVRLIYWCALSAFLQVQFGRESGRDEAGAS